MTPTQSGTVELKPCPFCGGEAQAHATEAFAYARCLSCKAEMSLCAGSLDDITAMWNARPSPWRHPSKGDGMPEEGQPVLLHLDRSYAAMDFRSCVIPDSIEIVRWLPIPEAQQAGEG